VDPVLIPLVAALIAFVSDLGGVVLGQRMARTTARQQIAAQERRDLELWAREDQHRFTEQRRVAYADMLAAGYRYRDLAHDVFIEVANRLNRRSDEEKADKYFLAKFVKERGYRDFTMKTHDEYMEVSTRFDIIAPEVVRFQRMTWQPTSGRPSRRRSTSLMRPRREGKCR
jgi:hypothetical protein